MLSEEDRAGYGFIYAIMMAIALLLAVYLLFSGDLPPSLKDFFTRVAAE
jgi:hypothetical protein